MQNRQEKKQKIQSYRLILKSVLIICSAGFLVWGFGERASAATEVVAIVRPDCANKSIPTANCYTSLAAWENTEQRDLVAADEIAVAQIEGSWTGADTTAVVVDGWSTGVDNYIKIYTTPEARHNGTISSSQLNGYRLGIGASTAMTVVASYVKIDGIAFEMSGAHTAVYISSLGGQIDISNCIMYQNGHGIEMNSSATVKIWNCIIVGVGYGISSSSANTGSTYIYNSTIINSNNYGIYWSRGYIYAFNVYASAASDDYHGTIHGSNRASADDTGSIGFQNIPYDSATFANTNYGNQNLHLTPTSGLVDVGNADPGSGLFSYENKDIDGDGRTENWDIGADEYIGADLKAPVISNINPAPSSSTAMIGWETNEGATSQLEYGLDASYGNVSTEELIFNVIHSINLSGLTPNTLYHYRVISKDLSDNAITSIDYTFTTGPPDTTSPSATSNLLVESCLTNSCTLTWTASGDDGSSGTAAAYDLRYSTSNIINDTNFDSAIQIAGEPTPSVAGRGEIITITGLSTGTFYYFALKTSDEAPNVSTLSNVVSETTLIPDVTAPTVPINLNITSTYSSTTDLTWAVSTDNTGVTGYNIYRCNGVCTPTVLIGTSPTNYYSDSGLSAATTYSYAVSAYDAASNFSAKAATFAVTTSAVAVPTTTSITRFGITWLFSEAVPYGQFANGDYWVLDAGSGVRVVDIAPLSTNIAGRIQHGSMLNPGTRTNGYDNTMNNVSYSAALNVGRPNGNDLSVSNPLIIIGENSLVSTRTNDVANTRPQPVDASVLTIVTKVPPAGSFRPPYAGTDKSFYWNTASIKWNLLPRLPKDSIAHLPNLNTLENQIERLWLDQGGGVWTGREFHPSHNMPDYGRDMSIITGNVSLALLLDYDRAELTPLMIKFLQLGIDWYGVTENAPNIFTTTSQGGLWMGGGGHGIGRKWPIMFSGLMFSDSNILKFADGEAYPIFQEEQQYFYVTQADVDRERYTDDGRPRDPYTTDMIGTPEWGESHWLVPARDGSNWDAYYRAIVSPSVPGFTLSAILMQARNLWNWEAFFDYQDRWWAYRKSIGQAGSYSSFVDDIWNTYRDYSAGSTIRGDVDGSSATNTTDSLLTLRNSLGLSMSATAWQTGATTGDVDCNGVSNSTDALLILRYSLGLGMGNTAWCE